MYQFRCPCCGIWLQSHPINRGKLIYCEYCTWEQQEDSHSFRKGRNSCKTCKTLQAEYGEAAMNHWQEEKPQLHGVCLVCMR